MNEQPGGMAARSGGCPSMAVSRSRPSPMRGIDESSASVYGCSGALKIFVTGPDSTTRPPYITAS